MKKLIIFLMALVAIITLSSCGKKSSKFIRFDDAYNKKYITKEDLSNISEKYQSSNIETLDTNTEIDILKIFCKENNVEYSDGIGTIRYYGTYSGYYALMVDGCKKTYAQATKTYNLDEVSITFPTSQVILMYKA